MFSNQNLKRIIVSRPDAIGDVVLTLPMCGLIKKYYPDSEIIFLGKEYTRAVVNCCEHVDQFLSFDELMKLTNEEASAFIKKMNADAIIHTFPHKKIAQLAKQAKIKLRVGTTNRLFHWTNINKFIFLSRKKSPLHESQLNCKLLEGIGIKDLPSMEQMHLYTGFTKINSPDLNLLSLIDKNKFTVILHPKSNGSGREWLLDNYKELINSLPSDTYQVFISGSGSNEIKILNEWIKTLPSTVVNITGKFSLPEFISFIKHADFLVASGTGPLHIAAACDIGAIGIFPPLKPIHPGRWKPIGKNAVALCKEISCNSCQSNPSSCPCMNEISGKQVASLIVSKEILSN